MDQDTSYTRVDDLWFPEGTLVIRAEGTIFRVIQSILAARSSVFRDMLALPQPMDSDAEIIDGSPAVYLHDSAADVEALLRAIFDSSDFASAPEPVKLDALLGILRLSHKYDVQYLFRRALRHLEVSLYFSSLQDFQDPSEDHVLYPPDKEMEGPCLSHFLNIILAAMEVGALWLLPIAYYEVSQYKCPDLMDSISLDTDRQAVVAKCVNAAFTLFRAHARSIRVFSMAPAGSSCTSPAQCNPARLYALDSYLYRVAHLNSAGDPLRDWASDVWGTISHAKFCDHCLPFYTEQHNSKLEALWEQLPSIFDLPGWQELEVMKTASMNAASSAFPNS
ncbi:hypothetical protein FB451DRAFT_1100212 [Mycena latifolia]|nr:hypothetical protein FB451DRAFT_1100212 [Mycena latifolia]